MINFEKSQKRIAKEAEDYTCSVCGLQGCKGCGYIHAHHIEHKYYGGSNDSSNLEVVCNNHHGAGHKTVESGVPLANRTQEIMRHTGELIPYEEKGDPIQDCDMVLPEPPEEHDQRINILKKRLEKLKSS